MKYTRTIPAVRLPTGLALDLQAEAQRRGATVSTIVREALATQLATKATPQVNQESSQ